jgi:hypothetical protein
MNDALEFAVRLVTHVVFGFGLFQAARATAWLFLLGW